jgi:hypothetical protein
MEPHSPWQILVDTRMRDLGVASRTLAKILLPARKSLNHTTVWAWTRNTDGYPPPATYSEEINLLLAQTLQLKPELLAKAYEDSRRHLIIKDNEASQRGPLRILRRIFAESSQKSWSSQEVIEMIDDIDGK